jgi:hypothetical protein
MNNDLEKIFYKKYNLYRKSGKGNTEIIKSKNLWNNFKNDQSIENYDKFIEQYNNFFTKVYPKAFFTRGDTCSICLDPMIDKVCKIDVCGHTFHCICINQVIRSDINECPLCKEFFIEEDIIPLRETGFGKFKLSILKRVF